MKKPKLLNIDSLSLQNILDDESELIPLMPPEDEEEINRETIPEKLAILPLRNTVLFPGVVIPITAGRDKSIELIKAANEGDKIIGVVAQKNESTENPGPNDVFRVGVVAQILRVLKMPDGNTTVIIQGKKRFEIDHFTTEDPYLEAVTKEYPENREIDNKKEFSAIIDSVKELALQVIQENPNIPSEASFAIKNIQSDSFLVNFISANMNLSTPEKQRILEVNDIKDRALLTIKRLKKELQRLELKNDIQSRVKTDLDQQQKEYLLHQQMKEIQNQLGENPVQQEINELREKSLSKKWSADVKKTFNKELDKLERMNPSGAEYGVQINYCQLLIDLPWDVYTNDKFNLKIVQIFLDRDHF